LKILVTGGAGFLGSHLSRSLLLQKHSVTVMDNLYTGRMKNIEDLLDNPGFTFINEDVRKSIDIEVDGIFNLACPASPIHYQSDPVLTLRTNVEGAINVLELASKYKARVLQASTSEVYGDPKLSPQSESYWGNVNPIGIRACYDEGKRSAETLFSDYHRQYGTDIRIARIFNTYGPAMSINDGRVVSNFVCQAIQNQPISIYGNGSQVRSFCYVSDLVEGLLKLFFKDKIYAPMNLGNPTPRTMQQLARDVIRISGSKSELVYKPIPDDDPSTREPDIKFANEILSWTPAVDLDSGLELTVKYFRQELEIA
jgi:UDP-glucuronate decarboxylase